MRKWLINSVNPAHTLMWKPSSKALMRQVLEKSNPDLPNVGLRYILVDYIKPRSPWRKGGDFWRLENHL